MKTKNLMSLFAAMMLAASLVACGGNHTAEKTDTVTQSEQSADAKNSAQEEEESDIADGTDETPVEEQEEDVTAADPDMWVIVEVNIYSEGADANGEKTTYAYNAQGRLTKVSDISGDATYEYDAEGKLILISYTMATVEFTYDADGTLLSSERLLNNGDSGHIYTEYDEEGRIIVKDDTINGTRTEYSYEYDAVLGSHLMRWDYTANGQTMTSTDADPYTYDADGHTVKGWDGLADAGWMGNYAPFWPETEGTGMDTETDAQGRIIREHVVDEWDARDMEYTYDDNGNLIEVKEVSLGFGGETISGYTYARLGDIIQ